MDRISLLPNDFLLEILSLLPTKDVLSTSRLSKRWRYLWKLVPKLEFIDSDENDDHGRFLRFVDRCLLLNTAPVLESLHFRLSEECSSDTYIGFWIRTAVERGLRELDFEYSQLIPDPSRLPQCLYTCGTLVVLKLKNVSLTDVQFPVRFPLLKTLHLKLVIFQDDESARTLLSSCPVLESLELRRSEEDSVNTFSVMVPSLQTLIYQGTFTTELVMDTPRLTYFETYIHDSQCTIKDMPDIVEAHVEIMDSNCDDILRSVTSVKKLLLCLPVEPKFPSGSDFNRLKHLEFCTCETDWNLLICMLQYSPELRSLKLNEIHDYASGDPGKHWEEKPGDVPESLGYMLETFEWRNYRGWIKEKELASFILKHSRFLKFATFYPQVSVFNTLEAKYGMATALTCLPRASPKCELVWLD